MARPAHTRITFSGVFGSPTAPVEVWAFNLCAPPNIAGANEGQMFSTLGQGLVSAYTTSIASHQSSDVVLTRVRVAAVKPDGRVEQTTAGAYVQGDTAASVVGVMSAASNIRYPLQTALVISLMTARAGATGKGRFFLPFPVGATALGTDFRIADAQMAGYVTRAKTFLNACKTALGTDLVVASTKGYLTPVTGVRIGRAPDTMRSRRGALLEGYSSATL